MLVCCPQKPIWSQSNKTFYFVKWIFFTLCFFSELGHSIVNALFSYFTNTQTQHEESENAEKQRLNPVLKLHNTSGKSTVCFTGLSKQAKFNNCGLSSSQFSLLSRLPQKNATHFKSGQNRHENNNSLI
jgi:hypothetical protein